MSRSLSWYARRLRAMSPGEVGARVGDRARQLAWARRRVAPGTLPPGGAGVDGVPGLLGPRRFASTVPAGTREDVPAAAREAVLAAADGILAGHWLVLGVPRQDVADPDWFADPVTGRRAPQDLLAFRVDHRDESVTGNVKSVWELSRHHHLTVLAAAWWLTGDDRYAVVVDRQLRSWWAANPFLSGVHWTSGIELGTRLVSWVWVRRLLDGWAGAPALFEDNPEALRQLRWHQEYLAAFRSRGSSSNNHLVAEAVGRLAAGCAFPWFDESSRWRRSAAADLESSLEANTFPSGVNREQASDYHRFVAELGLLGLVEADAAGEPLGAGTRRLLAACLDAAAAMVDATGRPPRQGDGDEGRGLVVDDPERDPWASVLAWGEAVVGPQPWWQPVPATVGSVLLGSLTGSTPGQPVAGRPDRAPVRFPDAGLYLLRTRDAAPEIWCRCDGGPQGFGSMAAHGHADALSVELRCDGVDLLADPGTYCYHGEPQWRSYFRSTLAHNTIEVDGQSQSVEGGPFLWSSRTDAVVDECDLDGEVQAWSAHHTGYGRLDPALRHDRQVRLDTRERLLTVRDTLTSSRPHTVRLAWHLGPEVEVALDGPVAELSWHGPSGAGTARLRLPDELGWAAHRGGTDPVVGWYSPRFGARVPATTLVGSGALDGELVLATTLDLAATRQAEAQRQLVGVTDAGAGTTATARQEGRR
ncbi:alginate lyase family protein [Phycicoccus sp. M110.8]|uniref:alginate lyase family protein n=1 Tax=Phycicoccus sp. M110.8 TaxID=3075433 RepID=UPI0028FD9911|nr:alginate lyase family protein [Phycicoccus sp. M110.8]MDU0313001.1 alginate lyase family protein [Phycicoccus sp. M110.8]